MNAIRTPSVVLLLLVLSAERSVAADRPTTVPSPYAGWQHSGSMFLLTTPDGADLPASASEADFPVLVRLGKDSFDFRQAKPDGADLRFSTPAGVQLAHQVDEWDAAAGRASIWVRIPTIHGNARQEIELHWGNPAVANASDGKAVFNASNGYVSVWHMSDPVRDEAGTLESKDVGTTAAVGMIGAARHFAGKQGIFCGDKIANYPAGASAHSSEAWFRAERSNATLFGWGNEGGGRGSKVRMQLRSPPHLHVDSDFSDVNGDGAVPLGEWVHVAHTYANSEGRIYVNGRLDGSAKPVLNIKNPARLWIGGWYNNYDFVGDIDEVRISSVARSPDWLRLEYENQKPLQSLAGHVVRPGDASSVSPASLTVAEGQRAALTAEAGGALKVYWLLKRDGRESIVATDRFNFTFDAGRVSGDSSATLQFKAVYANGVKTREVPIAIREDVPDPVFTLRAPATWDGRSPIEVVSEIANSSEMRASGAGDAQFTWAISNIAVTHETRPGKLILTRAQNSGTITVAATAHNGGRPVTRTAEIVVTEPARDPWLARTPDPDEKPVDGQFYARDDGNEGTLHYNGTLPPAAVGDSVFLKLYADETLIRTETAPLPAGRAYALSVKLKAGLIRYKVEFGSRTGERERVLKTANNLICGDAYLIDGQSNAEATAWGKDDYPFTSPWIRSFGSPDGSPQGARSERWGDAVARGRGGQAQIGYWGMELARRLVEGQKIPICILNGAVGGTRIDQHQRNPADHEGVTSIYGRLLWRVRQARLSHGIRGILWHQGENDQGADGPSGKFGHETYRQLFLDMAAGWKQDYPNVQHYYVFQIWPKSCAMGINGSDNRLREVQRTLPTAFARMSVMSTLGIDPPGGCHYPPAGYAEIARLICPLLERDFYGETFATPITPPNLKRASFARDRKDQIELEFDQPVRWKPALASQFYVDGEGGKVASGAVSGNRLTLRLAAASTARTISYLDSKAWSQLTLLRGENGIAALTFCEVPFLAAEPGR